LGLRSLDAMRLVLRLVMVYLWLSNWVPGSWAFPEEHNRPLGELAQQCRRAQQPGRFGVTAHS
jgi:hypothetical protein